MARIPAVELERLKREADLVGLVRQSGVELTGGGEELRGRCPFHEDDTPSLQVNVSKNVWHCLGACQAGGTAIDWVMRIRAVSFRHAVELLQGGQVEPAVEALPPLLATAMTDQELLNTVARYYADTYWKSADAQAYTAHRQIGDETTARTFLYGYCDRTLGYRMPARNVKEGRDLRDRLTALGLCRESGHEAMRGRLTIPITDDGGNVVGMYGRLIAPPQRDTPEHLYLKGPHRGVFNLAGIRGQQEVILCESILDALTFCAAGIHNVTTAYGVEGFTDATLEALKANQVKRVLIAFDRDEAGDRGAEKLTARLTSAGMEVHRVLFPHGTDVNEYAQLVKPAAGALAVAVRGAVFEGKGIRAAATTSPAPLPAPPPPHAPVPAPQEEPAPVQPSGEPEVTPAADSFFTEHGDDLVAQIEDRTYRVRGLERNGDAMVLKVNLRVWRGDRFHVDTLDLNLDRLRNHFIKVAATELQLPEEETKRDVGTVLRELEARHDQRLKALKDPGHKTTPMTTEERNEAEAFLRDPRLLDLMLKDVARLGVVGEETNKLVCYLAATSRKLRKPLAIMVRSESGAGKTSLVDVVLSLMPDDDLSKYSAMTGQSLFYMGEKNLRHKVLALAEEEGAERASYALKLLQSEGRLSIASTVKDAITGMLSTKDYIVEGPVAVFLTTTREQTDEEFLNRCVELGADESRAQTKAIHDAQRWGCSLEGILAAGASARIRRRHKNAQRLLRALPVFNPYHDFLGFPTHRMRLRRDNRKYLTLIEASAVLHQFQRQISQVVTDDGEVVDYVTANLEDVALANRIAVEILGRSLDEIPTQTLRFRVALEAAVRQACSDERVELKDYRFTARWMRQALNLGATQVKVHVRRLLDVELMRMYRQRGGDGVVYELVDEPQVDAGLAQALTPVETLKQRYDEARSGSGRPGAGGGTGVRKNGASLRHVEEIGAAGRAVSRTTDPGRRE